MDKLGNKSNKTIKMNYRSVDDLSKVILKNLNLIPDSIDLVMGIPRSGLLPSFLISLYRNVPYCDFNTFALNGGFTNEMIIGGERLQTNPRKEIKNILIVDDSLWTGNAMNKARERIARINKYNFLFSVIYLRPGYENLVDLYFESLDDPRIFQWNIFHHSFLENACIDIDGVLCRDPSEDENDDKDKYLEFILNTKPLYLPKVKVNTIVSCRLEKYRKATEGWMAKNNVKFENLVLLDLPDKDARVKWNKYAEYKAEIYIRSKCNLFIESSITQARIINMITKKPVFCTENFEMITIASIPNSRKFLNDLKVIFPRRLRKVVKFFINYQNNS
jgi:uncharacterized HAD superfamily protein